MKAARPPPRQPPEFIISPLAFGEQEGGKKMGKLFPLNVDLLLFAHRIKLLALFGYLSSFLPSQGC
jgi:hypothetical protein